jgi:hypothetical protein
MYADNVKHLTRRSRLARRHGHWRRHWHRRNNSAAIQ